MGEHAAGLGHFHQPQKEGHHPHQADGQFQVVSQTPGLVVGDAWSDFLPGSKDLIADWRKPLSCGNYNVKTAKCSGQNY